MKLKAFLFKLKCLNLSAFSGDISCDFETQHWDSGFCNWQYDFNSENLLEFVEAPTSDLTLKKRWKNGESEKTVLIKINVLNL